MKKKVIVVLILIGLIALDGACFLPADAQYQGDITINSDGSITPPTTLIAQTGDTYTLTGDLNNTANNLAGSLTVEKNNCVIDGNGFMGGQVLLSTVYNVTVENFEMKIVVYNAEPHGYNGILVKDSSNVTVTNNTIQNMRGIDEFQSVGGKTYAGIRVEGGNSNTIIRNNLRDNQFGIYLYKTQNNLVAENTIIDDVTDLIGPTMAFDQASNNTIVHNNIRNAIFILWSDQVSIYNSSNVWDLGFPGGGNYWIDYHHKYPNATEIDNSKIGDTPYLIDSQNVDHYPLKEPFNSTFFALQTTPPQITMQSPINQTYQNTTLPLSFTIDVISQAKLVNWTGYSLDGQQNVTVTGNTSLTGLSSGAHSIRVFANDSYGNIGASETLTFDVLESFPFAAAALVSVVVGVVLVAFVVVLLKKRK